MAPSTNEEFVVLRRKANLRFARGKAVGTLQVTTQRLLFRPLGQIDNIDISFEEVDAVETIGRLVKKMRVTAGEKRYTFFMRNTTNVIRLVRQVMKASKD